MGVVTSRSLGKHFGCQSSLTHEEHLLSLYCVGALDAKSFCIACYWASKSGSIGEGMHRYALAPGNSTGNYSKHLNRYLPTQEGAPELDLVEVPVMYKGKRVTKTIPVSPIHEVMEAEFATLADNSEGSTDETDWSEVFREHPHRVRPGDSRQTVPIAIYLDGIKYNRAIGPRADSLIGVTAYNLRTTRRHLVAVVSKQESVGWDTLWPILNHMRWSLAAAAEGKRPTRRWDGREWPADSHYASTAGSDTRARYILCQIKADWMEFCQSLGFPSWASANSPCFCCAAVKATLFDFRCVNLEDDPWGAKPTTYDEECRKSEIEVTVNTEGERRAILEIGGLHTETRNKKFVGRILTNPIDKYGLKSGDRLEPSNDLQNTADFETRPLPFVCVFWRRWEDARGRISSWVLRRCPLFSPEVGAVPQTVLHLDTLHTLYQGPMATFVYEVIHAAMEQDLFGLGGARESRDECTLERLMNNYTFGPTPTPTPTTPKPDSPNFVPRNSQNRFPLESI